MHLVEGALLQGGKYRIVKVLGQGGFGITYLGYQETLGRHVAIKEFFMEEYCERGASTSQVSVYSASRADMVSRYRQKFVKEARMIACLEHHNIVSIYDVFEENGTAYYVMKYINGVSMSEYLRQSGGSLTEQEALCYIRQISEALSYIHGLRINHLDIKPGNILLDDRKRTILIDFGLSKRYDESGDETSSTPIGISHGYAPLEQYKKGGVGKFSPTADIYSLGALLYKLLTGETPPSAVSLASGEELPPLPSGISPSTRRAVSVAMELNKGKRPQSISEFLSILDGGQSVGPDDESTVPDAGKGPSGTGPVQDSGPDPSGPSSGAGKGKDRRRRRILRRTLVSLCVLAGLAVGMYVLRPLFQSGGVFATGQPDSISVSGMVPDSLHKSGAYSDSVRKAEMIKRKRDSIRRVEEELREREAAASAALEYVRDSIAEANRKQEAAREVALRRIQDSLSRMQAQAEKDRQEQEASALKERESSMFGRGTENGHDWVDLGLSVKWATCNVGASSPSDYGSYYAWGETSTQSSYTKDNSRTYGVGMGSISGHSRYDVAHAEWGGSWRLPTEAEMEELVEKCRWEWTSQGGHKGYRVTGPNGASVFLPAAGWRYDTSLNSAGGYGGYWTSTPHGSNTQYAYGLGFDSGNRRVFWYYRFRGYSVRPVKE